MVSQKLRRDFLQYFKSKGHKVVPSSPVVPHDDPTLLFVNAGMNQFKDVFLGKSSRDYTKAASCQKCIRVGGKHNDLENVGHTTRHLTFFEMLGNFSFGDYFKKEAIDFAYDVATNIFGLNPEQIFATVFFEDEEAFELWKLYLPENRIVRMGEKDNFWAMGDIGPCGPCSELLFDRGSHFGKARSPAEDIAGERFFEFWNLVFMQFNRRNDGTLEPLPKQSVDTGAGLERIALLKMGVDSVFETDILRSIIAEAENLFGIKYESQKAAFNVIADHLRSLSFAIADGVVPGNIDRGYVLRKVLRRAVRYGRSLGVDKPFLANLLPRFISLMGEDYPELVLNKKTIGDILTLEEENFLKTLHRGGNILNQVTIAAQNTKQISGEDAFKLKDTYGLPLEEILLLAKDSNLTVDILRFEELEKEAKERSRATKKGAAQELAQPFYMKLLDKFGKSVFSGFEALTSEATVLSIMKDEKEVNALHEGEEGAILMTTTPFYAEKGGQVGDTGILSSEKGSFSVFDTKNPVNDLIFHHGIQKQGEIHVGDQIVATVDPQRRKRIANNHTATHLLHYALTHLLGPHIKQAGSIVEPNRLRFDFHHPKALTKEEISQIEDLVNEKIRENTHLNVYEIPQEEALKHKEIKQFFGDKYGKMVRVIDIDYSKELCGGTHATHTGDIGFFRIVKESSIASGVRRIEAVTGIEAEKFVKDFEEKVLSVKDLLKVQDEQILEKIKSLITEKDRKEKELVQMEYQHLKSQLISKNDLSFLIQEVQLSAKDLKNLADLLFEKQKGLAVFLITKEGNLFVKVSKDLQNKLRADQWLKDIAIPLNGKGGGNADMAQGSVPGSEIATARNTAHQWIQKLF